MADKEHTYTAHVYRFNDAVSVHLGTGETTYISHLDARALAAVLTKIADNIEALPFGRSSAATLDRALTPARNYTLRRTPKGTTEYSAEFEQILTDLGAPKVDDERKP